MLEFFAMGGYAAYVWSSFGLTFLVLWLNWWTGHRRHLAVRSRIAQKTASSADNRGATVKEISV